MPPKRTRPIYKPLSIAEQTVQGYASLSYRSDTVIQTVSSESFVQFNTQSVITGSIRHNVTTNNDEIRIVNAGVYKIDYKLMITPQTDLSSPYDDSVFGISVNNVVDTNSIYGNGQFNSSTPFQIIGSVIVNIPANSIIQLQNIGDSDAVLTNIIDNVPINSANITIVKL